MEKRAERLRNSYKKQKEIFDDSNFTKIENVENQIILTKIKIKKLEEHAAMLLSNRIKIQSKEFISYTEFESNSQKQKLQSQSSPSPEIEYEYQENRETQNLDESLGLTSFFK